MSMSTKNSTFYFLCACLALSVSACSYLGNNVHDQQASLGGGILRNLRPSADPALVERIRQQEEEEAKKQAAQGNIASETAGANGQQNGLGRNLPKVYTTPFSAAFAINQQTTTSNTAFNANYEQNQANNAAAQAAQNIQLATYETAYSSAPPPPPGSLAAGLVPPPPAVTLSTQAQTYGETAANFYNNAYFNPYGVPAPPQASMPEKRPSLFGDSSQRTGSDSETSKASTKHKADFIPITPTGMEARSPYKQRDDLRTLWKECLKASINIGSLSDNKRLIDNLSSLEIGLPSESSRGNFNVSSRQVENIFKSASIDGRSYTEIRKVQTELVQAYYRYLAAYNKYALTEQTVAARQQEVDVSDSDSERQRAAADLAQSKNDLDSARDDMHSAEIELASASSATGAHTVIGHIAKVAPSIESLAQASTQSNNIATNASARRRFSTFMESVFHHHHDGVSNTENVAKDDTPPVSKHIAKVVAHSSHDQASSDDSASDDLTPSPSPEAKISSHSVANNNSEEDASPKVSASNNVLNFELKGVNLNPRKSVLTVAVKNAGNNTFELNPENIYITENNHRLASASMRADFDITSIEPDHEVKGTITVLGRPWNDHLMVYLNDGKKNIQLKRN